MLKFKRKRSMLNRVYNKKNKHSLPGKKRDSYRWRTVMRVRAKRLDIRIRCPSCRRSHAHGSIAAAIMANYNRYAPFNKFVCAECKGYMRGGAYLHQSFLNPPIFVKAICAVEHTAIKER